MFSGINFVCVYILLFVGGVLNSKEEEALAIYNKKVKNPTYLAQNVDETLELICNISSKLEVNHYILKWNLPNSTRNSLTRLTISQLDFSTVLKLEHLRESDSGDYKCEAERNSTQETFYKNVTLYVRKTDPCEKKFHCGEPNKCIANRYKCDGKKDCNNGADESPEHCGPNPCNGRIRCTDGRCIPLSWCCFPSEPNCTSKSRHECCPKKDHDSIYLSNQQIVNDSHYNDLNFLQTTVYTVIGCAMVFMCIVMILVISICRAHMRRAILSTLPLRQHSLNTTAYHRALTQEVGVGDLDFYFNRLEVPSGVLVTYNINNGVQILSDSIEPPPYSEVASTPPPREGPPPPYSPMEVEGEICTSGERRRSPKPNPRRHGLSNVKVSSEPSLSNIH